MADKIVFLILAGAAVCFLLHRLVYGRKKTNLIWALLVFTGILVLVYKLNPNNRIYSYHGFMHAGIVYQILNGEIPPSNAVMAGTKLTYPWGYEYIAAGITDIFDITPFYTFAIINVISLLVCMMVIYKISRLLIKDDKANILSVIISLFGPTVLNSYLVMHLNRINIVARTPGVPVWEKFSNINGIPLGLIFYLLFLYSVIRIFVDSKCKLMALLFLLSVAGCGFVYPQFLPGIMASGVLVCLVNLLWHRKENPGLYVRKSLLIIGLLTISGLMLYPYVSSIGSSAKGSIELFNFKSLSLNGVTYLIVCFPILLVIFLGRRFLWKNLDKRALIIILAVIASTFCCYILIHLPLTNEYKFLMLSMVTLGILGGVSFGAMRQRWNKSIVFILLLIFVFPAFSSIYTKLRHYEHLPSRYVEKGKYIYSKNAEENELYEWIRRETNTDDVFIDSGLVLPVLAQRPLFVAWNKKVKGRVRAYPGYGFIWRFFQSIWGYDADLVRKRNNIVYSIYSSNRQLGSGQKEELLAYNNVYVIVRKAFIRRAFSKEGFNEVFRSSQGNFLVYRCTME